MRARTVNETQNFERGKDPREQMGIGDAEVQTINKLDRLARKYGFEDYPILPEEEEEDIIDVKKWINPETECQIVLYKHENWNVGNLYINYEDPEGGSGNDSVESWLDPERWEYYYGEDRGNY